MKEFDAWSILTNCSPVLDGVEQAKVEGSSVEHWVAPRMYCAWDRGYYVQPIIAEFDFSKFAPKHAAKRSFFLLRVKNGEVKKFKNFETQKEYNLPVVSFYIFINKKIFPPLDGQNQIEWLNSRTPRTTAIAHELVFADQYATRYDVANPKGFSVTIPTPAQEEELMCPSFEIEALLHSVEKHFAVDLGTFAAFNAQQQTKAIQDYYQMWLKKHAVEDNVVRNRTSSYLAADIRRHHGGIATKLEESKKKHNLDNLDAASFLRHMRQNSPFAKDFVAGLLHNGLIAGFQQLHTSCCIGSKQMANNHTCNGAFHNQDGGCSAVRCDFIRHTNILLQRKKAAK